jgi:hypothetical protein
VFEIFQHLAITIELFYIYLLSFDGLQILSSFCTRRHILHDDQKKKKTNIKKGMKKGEWYKKKSLIQNREFNQTTTGFSYPWQWEVNLSWSLWSAAGPS